MDLSGAFTEFGQLVFGLTGEQPEVFTLNRKAGKYADFPGLFFQLVCTPLSSGFIAENNYVSMSVSCMVCYEDPGAFRKVFQRTMGLSPGEYHPRFGVADAE